MILSPPVLVILLALMDVGLTQNRNIPQEFLKVTFAPNLAKKLSSLFYYLILLFQLSVANPENFEEFKAREVLKIRKEKTGILPTSLVRSLSQ